MDLLCDNLADKSSNHYYGSHPFLGGCHNFSSSSFIAFILYTSMKKKRTGPVAVLWDHRCKTCANSFKKTNFDNRLIVKVRLGF